jgi:hypothetical protein
MIAFFIDGSPAKKTGQPEPEVATHVKFNSSPTSSSVAGFVSIAN